MNPTVRPLTSDREKAWDDFVAGNESATFFHLTGWKRVVEKTFGFKPYYLASWDGDRIEGILPLFLVPRLPTGKCLMSIPFAVYGGIVAEGKEAEGRLFESARELLERVGGRYLELRHVGKSGLPLAVKDLYATFRRPIFSSEEANLNAIPRKERAEIRKGIKNGLVSRIGGEEHLDRFFRVYGHSVRNLGSPVYPKALFRNLLEEFKERCRIMTVWHRESMAAGVMTFFFKDQVMPYYGGALKEGFALSVNDFMYWELMRYGLENGYGTFDFGRSKKGTGPYRFKEHWGFVPQPLSYEYLLPGNAPMPDASPANPRYAAAISLWKKLPQGLTDLLGPPLSRYFP